MRKITHLCFFLYTCIVLLTACSNDKKTEKGFRKAKGPENLYYGGILKINETESFISLYPPAVSDVVSGRIVHQIYEGLVKLDQSTLAIIPSLAEKWTKNEDATSWSFQLRKGVYFQDDSCFADGKGRLITAKDVKYCFDMLCTASNTNNQFFFTLKDRVAGANEYYESSKYKRFLPGGVEGIRVIDDYTLQLSLLHPIANFDNILCQAGCLIYPKEMIEHYGANLNNHAVGTGPFKLGKVIPKSVVEINRNENYWSSDEFGNKLPYLDGVKITFIDNKQQELVEFRKGNLDMVYLLPSDVIGSILAEFKNAKIANRTFQLQVTPAMNTFIYFFNLQKEAFKDPRVRMAFNLALDREKITNSVLKGDGIPATFGLIPQTKTLEGMGYDFSLVKGYEYNVQKARALLSEAGYPNGKNFPQVVLESDIKEENALIAQALQEMFKENLNVDIEIREMPFSQLMQRIQNGQSDLWKLNWAADYPDGESFLCLFNGKFLPNNSNEPSRINISRYKSEKFDSLYASAINEVDMKKRATLYLKANQVLIDEAIVMPLFYVETYRMLQSNIRKLDINPLEYRNYTSVHMIPRKDDKKLKPVN